LNQRTGFAAVLWSSCLAMLAVGANSTAIMAALPSMRTELGLSSTGVEWAVNAYLVVSAAFIVLGGQAADRFGARLSSMAGLAPFRGLRLKQVACDSCFTLCTKNMAIGRPSFNRD
jgi:MFS family permease